MTTVTTEVKNQLKEAIGEIREKLAEAITNCEANNFREVIQCLSDVIRMKREMYQLFPRLPVPPGQNEAGEEIPLEGPEFWFIYEMFVDLDQFIDHFKSLIFLVSEGLPPGMGREPDLPDIARMFRGATRELEQLDDVYTFKKECETTVRSFRAAWAQASAAINGIGNGDTFKKDSERHLTLERLALSLEAYKTSFLECVDDEFPFAGLYLNLKALDEQAEGGVQDARIALINSDASEEVKRSLGEAVAAATGLSGIIDGLPTGN